jgi:hypothetical protein
MKRFVLFVVAVMLCGAPIALLAEDQETPAKHEGKKHEGKERFQKGNEFREGPEQFAQKFPEAAEKMQQLKEKSPELARQFFRETMEPAGKRMQHFKEAGSTLKDQVKSYVLAELDSYLLAADIAVETEAAKIEQLKIQLKETLKKAFTIKTEIEKAAVAAMEKRLTEMKAKIEKRASLGDAVVEKRFDQLTNTTKDDSLGW